MGRIILLQLMESWLGREDHELEQRLQTELPGILNWSLDGLQRLTTVNGTCFTRVASADESISTMEELASPVRAFVRQRCRVAGNLTINKDLLFETYKLWADKNGVPKKDYAVFARERASCRSCSTSLSVTPLASISSWGAPLDCLLAELRGVEDRVVRLAKERWP